MKLSYTALKTFQQCHFHYHLRYHRGLPSRPRPAAQSSRALHGALHLFHRGLQHHQREGTGVFPPETVALATLLAHFKSYYDNPLRPLTEQQYQEGTVLLKRSLTTQPEWPSAVRPVADTRGRPPLPSTCGMPRMP